MQSSPPTKSLLQRADWLNVKTLAEFQTRTYAGGLISLVAVLAIAALAVAEFATNFSLETVDKMMVDGQRNRRVTIEFDVVFPRMPCSLISIDAGDLSGNVQRDIDHHIKKVRLHINGSQIDSGVRHDIGGALVNETHLESKVQQKMMEKKVKCGECYGAGKKGQCCNTCDDVRRAYQIRGWQMPSLHTVSQCNVANFEEIVSGKVKEGCNILGYIEVDKVAGKFFFAPSKIFSNGYLHAKDVISLTFNSFNNSHHINHLSFGSRFPNMKNPLDSRGKVVPYGAYGLHQYFLKVISTDFHYISGKTTKTNQYSVTEHFLNLSPNSNKGFPGVSFSYEFSPIKFRIEQQRKGILQFLTSLCAIVGGIFTIMGVVDSFVHSFFTQNSGSSLTK